ncbi:hypothetical protein G5V59_08870 [Nocardioides sp. W3-2-3]|nr:hypothetical protein [Nocardioides convexus]
MSKMDASKGPVTAVSRSLLGEVRLLGGLVTLGGVETIARTTSDGKTGKATGKAVYGKMAVAGQEFGLGPDGAIVSGKTMPIPGLSDLPGDALKRTRHHHHRPEAGAHRRRRPRHQRVRRAADHHRHQGSSRPCSRRCPSARWVSLIPAEAGPLKSVVLGLGALSPRIVLTIGAAQATVDTVPPIDVVPVTPPGTAPAGTPPATATGAVPKPAAGSVGVPPAAGAPAPAGAAPAPTAGAPVGDLVDAAPASAGLPQPVLDPGDAPDRCLRARGGRRGSVPPARRGRARWWRPLSARPRKRPSRPPKGLSHDRCALLPHHRPPARRGVPLRHRPAQGRQRRPAAGGAVLGRRDPAAARSRGHRPGLVRRRQHAVPVRPACPTSSPAACSASG